MSTEDTKNMFSNFTKLFGNSKTQNTYDDNLDNIIIKTNANEDIEAGDNSGMLNKLKLNVSESIEVEKSYKSFFITIAIGFGFLALSVIFLPFVILQPQKFLSMFSIGSIFILGSFIFIHGTKEYFMMLFDTKRKWFTIAYLISLLLGFYYAFIKGYFLISLICTGIQLITLVIFTLSFIPGGNSGISMILTLLQSPALNMISKFKGTNQ